MKPALAGSLALALGGLALVIAGGAAHRDERRSEVGTPDAAAQLPVALPPADAGAPVLGTAVGPVGTALPTSLRDTDPDGDWRVDAQGRLVVERAVRRRFDYWLSSLGERSAEDLERQVLTQARQALPPAAAEQLAVVWRGYLAVQRHAWQRVVQPGQPGTWRVALEERQSVRRRLLGTAWAEAFYGDEQRRLWAQILAWESGQPLPADEAGSAVPLHPQAAQRVAEVEAQWAQWEQRLAQARSEWARLVAAPELSAVQRDEAMARWLAQRFTPSELVRVRALLGLP